MAIISSTVSGNLCNIQLVLEQAKRGTPETSECTYQKELEKVTSDLKKTNFYFASQLSS